MKTALSICSGGGLADIGIRAAGFTPVAAFELEPTIAEVYRTNLGHCANVGDVCAVNWRKQEKVDLIWASPSCKNASVANAKGGESALDLAVADSICRALRTLRPKYFILENVQQYLHFKAFQMIVDTLEQLGYWQRAQVFNMANWGVPQTRVRLILRATHPDHADTGQGGLFGGGRLAEIQRRESWNGWLGAIDDLVEGLPESQFAPWQIEKFPDLGKLYATTYCELRNIQNGGVFRGVNDPSPTVTATNHNRTSCIPKAFIVDSLNTGSRNGATARRDAEHRICVPASSGKAWPRAFLFSDQSEMTVRDESEPSTTVLAGASKRSMTSIRALIVEGSASGADNKFTPPVRTDKEPVFTMRAAQNNPRALLETGRVVRMTPRALARFQSVPDFYELPEGNVKFLDGKRHHLAATIIGNGVPCLFAQKLVRIHCNGESI